MRHANPTLLALSLLLAAAPVRGENVSPSPSQPPRPTYQALERLTEALRQGAAPALDSLLTSDHTTHAYRDGVAGFLRGRARAEVLDSLTSWSRPGAAVWVFADGLSEAADPEHPDSLEHYRLLIVRRFELKRAGDTLFAGPHVLHLVRGDAAVLANGAPRDARRWYVRRWLMDLSRARRELSQRRVGPADPRLASPALPVRDSASVARTLTLEVFDVQGRPMNRVERALAPGAHSLEAGAGAALVPGVYWLRITRTGAAPECPLRLVGR